MVGATSKRRGCGAAASRSPYGALTRDEGDPPRFHMSYSPESEPIHIIPLGACIMSSLIGMSNFATEDYIVSNPGLKDREFCVEGPVVGYFAGHPIPGAVVDPSGNRYHYAGLAPRLRDGRFDVRSLHPGEWIVEPGLVFVSDRPLGHR